MINLKNALRSGLLTFFLALIFTLVSRSLLTYVSLGSAFFLLVIIVFIGVIFDLIGVAATAAQEGPFNARAAKKIAGARQALMLVRNADKVASFCCDIVGDICGTLSGAVGATIVFNLVSNFSLNELLLDLLVISIIAAFTVGGKAYGKSIGIKKAHEIIFFIGKLLSFFKTWNARGKQGQKNRAGK